MQFFHVTTSMWKWWFLIVEILINWPLSCKMCLSMQSDLVLQNLKLLKIWERKFQSKNCEALYSYWKNLQENAPKHSINICTSQPYDMIHYPDLKVTVLQTIQARSYEALTSSNAVHLGMEFSGKLNIMENREFSFTSGSCLVPQRLSLSPPCWASFQCLQS